MNATSTPHQPTETDDWLSLKAASAMLGVATSTLRRWGASGRLPMRRICEAVLFFRSTFSQLALLIPGIAQSADLLESARLRARIERIMDAMLLGVIAGFEQACAEGS